MTIVNPMRTDGFEFVEYAAPDPDLLRRLFQNMGLPAVARHRSKDVTLHALGDVNFTAAQPGGAQPAGRRPAVELR
jgi:4-hydroxyphenylpyruvate dioxygenase